MNTKLSIKLIKTAVRVYKIQKKSSLVCFSDVSLERLNIDSGEFALNVLSKKIIAGDLNLNTEELLLVFLALINFYSMVESGYETNNSTDLVNHYVLSNWPSSYEISKVFIWLMNGAQLDDQSYRYLLEAYKSIQYIQMNTVTKQKIQYSVSH